MFWLYCLNIRIFNDDFSYCYYFTECDGKKKPTFSCVFSFPLVAIIVYLSDAAVEQNRNISGKIFHMVCQLIGRPDYLMVTCRSNPSPFEVIMDIELLKKWEKNLSQFMYTKPISKHKLSVTIMKYVIRIPEQWYNFMFSERPTNSDIFGI
ncbi:hypothetical protein PR048_015621 [Dryococelus australis]|uniref:Uncharacterized protein n=1 Tax=Dryococelus australis TaxID=614101 RepID=A0ABQ9HHE8_9NEOP|nr:hypothetical protein PR048_015621 [Dryococelus australis]